MKKFLLFVAIVALVGSQVCSGADPVKIDHQTSLNVLQVEAKKGNADAQVKLGLNCIKQKDFDSAANWFQQAAEADNAEGQANYGACFLLGAGRPEDTKQAVFWFKKSTDQGYAGGQWRLGACYESGDGVPKDEKRAFELYRLSAEQGDLDGMRNYAAKLEQQGKIEDAIQWYKKAAELGKREAEWRMGTYYAGGVVVDGKTIVPKDEKQAFEWFKKAAEHNSPEGLMFYAQCLLTGTGTKQDKKGGISALRKSAELGQEVSQHLYGTILMSPQHSQEYGVQQDVEKGLTFIFMSAEQGHQPAIEMMLELKKILDSQQTPADDARMSEYDNIKRQYQRDERDNARDRAEFNAASRAGMWREIREDEKKRQEHHERERNRREEAEREGRQYIPWGMP